MTNNLVVANEMGEVSLKGDVLANTSVISHNESVNEIRAEIQKNGLVATIQSVSKASAKITDRFYITVLIAGQIEGIFRLEGKEDAPTKFNGKGLIQQKFIGMFAAQQGQVRKNCQDITALGWAVTRAGFDPLDFPSVAALRRAVKPHKTIEHGNELSALNPEPIEQAPEVQALIEEAKIMAAEIQSTHQLVDAIKADLMAALYGSQAEKKALREKYPLAA